jgi:hypothetical protein
MNPKLLIDRLRWFGEVLPNLVAGIADADARWKPADGAWSIVETVRHLLDEEIDDFRQRLRLTLESPQQDWPAIDPEGWAVARRYNEAPLVETAERFAAERRKSVAWLTSLGPNVDWNQAHTHPQFGSFPAGDLLAAWAAHDALHLRQIAKRLHQLAGRDGGTFSTQYAGEWKA